MQRYIDYKKLQRLMKDISGFSASQRVEGKQPMMHIQPKQVQQASHCCIALTLACSASATPLMCTDYKLGARGPNNRHRCYAF